MRKCLQLLVSMLLSLLLIGTSAHAAYDRQDIMLGNVLGTGVVTLIVGWVQGSVKTFEDSVTTFAGGCVAGYGFVRSRDLIARDKITEGVALAYLSSSVAENATFDENWLAYIRYGTGPFEVRLATPFAENPKSYLEFDVDILELMRGVYFLTENHDISIRNGIVSGISSVDYGTADAWTRGRYISRHREAIDQPDIWVHEAIHVTQTLQTQSFLARWEDIESVSSAKRKRNIDLIGFGFRAGAFEIPFGLYQQSQKYEHRWVEKEAYWYQWEYRDNFPDSVSLNSIPAVGQAH